jgi:hypothetical protein
MMKAQAMIAEHDQATERWHSDVQDLTHPELLPTEAGPLTDFRQVALAQHRANFDLWHEEDDARSPDASDARIAQVKHAIDRYNQRRNDLVECLDTLLLAEAGLQNEAAPLHSETPGLIIDRLSILALKIYHTAVEAHRASASAAHRQRNLARLSVLVQQRADLAQCLDQLWVDVLHGQRRFRLYRQMKMYNDPELNPALYLRHTGPG